MNEPIKKTSEEEKITLEEYEARRSQSTCVCSIITERMFEKGVD